MALSTYSELKTSVADWLNRSDLTSAVPDFISLAEAQVERRLRTRQMIVRATATIDSEYSAVPADFLEARSLKLQTNPITPVGFETIDSLDNLSTRYTSSASCEKNLPSSQYQRHRVLSSPCMSMSDPSAIAGWKSSVSSGV